MNVHVDAQFVKAQIARLLTEYPELAEDETLRADVLEGATSIDRLIEAALSELQEAEMMAAALKEREADLYARRGRFERKSEAMKRLIKSVMRAADLAKMTLPEATLSITAGRAKVNVLDVNELPQGYYRTKREVDMTALKSALEKGEEIPGAELVHGEAGLMIRSK
jgi:hypothetical protein